MLTHHEFTDKAPYHSLWAHIVFIQDSLEGTIDLDHELFLSGMGVGLLTHALAGQSLKKGELVEITVQDMPRLQRESLLVYRTADSPLPTAVNEWLRFFREEARQYCLA